MGGAAGVSLLLGMFRVKFAALLMGTTGVGLLTSFTSIQGFFVTLFGLGIQSSAVREVAAAVGRQDEQAIGRAVLILRRVCWLTGLLGMAVTMAFSPTLSQLTFGSDAYTFDIAALGLVILFSNISGGQMVLIQGMRRIGDMARANILGAALATLVTMGFYIWLGLRGIAPALVSIAAIQLALSWHFARRVLVSQVVLDVRQTFREAGSMVRLGLVFMWNGLLGGAVSYLTVTFITQQISLQAVGLYSAAFALSGIFVNFVLGAMGADYYPRLTGVAYDKPTVNQLVNEQTEIGLLLAVPGLLATLALAPWIIRIFFTGEFLPAVELLPWFILGCFGRVISWPLGYVMLALGKGKLFFATETTANLAHLALIALGLAMFGLIGVAIAFFVLYIGYTLTVLAVAHHLTGFVWSAISRRLIALTLVTLTFTFIITTALPLWSATLVGTLITVIGAIYSLRMLVQRIGTQHRITCTVCKFPGMKLVCGLK